MSQASDAGHVSQHTHIEAIRASQQGYLEIGAIDGDPNDIRHKRYIQRWLYLTGDNTADLLNLIDQLAAKYGNVYCSRVLYEQPRRDRALALPTRLLFLDDAPPGSYTYTIETSPQSMHAYILLDELISPEQAEQLGRRLAYHHGADQGGWDITQIVRVPGTHNTKACAGGSYDDKRRWIAGSGHAITLTKRTGRAYSVAEITEATQTTPALPIDALDPASVAVWQGNLADLLTRDGLPKRWKNPDITGWKVLRGDIHTKSSSEARYHIIASLVLHGYPDDEIAALALHLTNFGKMETKGSSWLYRDIARCTRKARHELADQGKIIIINPSRPGRTRAPAQLPQRTPARRGRKCKGSPASYYDRLCNEASGDQIHWTLGQAAVEMDVSVATIKRWEVVLKAEGKIERVTVSTRQHSYLAILGQLKIHESAPNQAHSEVSSHISVQPTDTPPNDNQTPNAWENHRGASLPPGTPSLAPSLSSVAAPSLFDDQADDQADEAPASVLALADDLADNSLSQDELACGTELTGPAGALVVVGGAAYVPPVAEPWYVAICAAIAPPPDQHPDDQAEAVQLVTLLDAGDRAELVTGAGQGDAGDQTEPAQPASVPATKTKKSRTAPKWVRELHAYMQRLALMSGAELAGEVRKWHNTEKKLGRAGWITGRIEAVEREIEGRDLLGGSTSDLADTPDSDDQADLSSPDGGPQAPEGERTGVSLPPPLPAQSALGMLLAHELHHSAGCGARRSCAWTSTPIRCRPTRPRRVSTRSPRWGSIWSRCGRRTSIVSGSGRGWVRGNCRA